jgi:hypothetical protein
MRITAAGELGDDPVVEPLPFGLRMRFSDYGVPVSVHSSISQSIAYTFNFPSPRRPTGQAGRGRFPSIGRRRCRKAILRRNGDVLPVVLGNYDPFVYQPDVGDPATWGSPAAFSWASPGSHRFIGNQGLLYWVTRPRRSTN